MMSDRRISSSKPATSAIRRTHDANVKKEVLNLRGKGNAPRIRTTLPFYEKTGSGFATSIAHSTGVTVVKTWHSRAKQVELTPKGE